MPLFLRADLSEFEVAEVLRSADGWFDESAKLEVVLSCKAVQYRVPQSGNLQAVQTALVAHVVTQVARSSGGDMVALASSLRNMFPTLDWSSTPENEAPRVLARGGSAEPACSPDVGVDLGDFDFFVRSQR